MCSLMLLTHVCMRFANEMDPYSLKEVLSDTNTASFTTVIHNLIYLLKYKIQPILFIHFATRHEFTCLVFD